MEVVYTKKSLENLDGLPLIVQRRIVTKLSFYAAQAAPLKFAERLADPYLGDWRFRVGDYRIIFDVIDGKIVVFKIARRDEIYK